MGLWQLPEIQSLFVCPRCRAPLVDRGNSFLCSNTGCPYARDDGFSIAAGQPELVDFERSVLIQSVVQSTAGASTTSRTRRGLLTQGIKDIIFGKNSVARGNAGRFRDLLFQLSSHPVVLVVGGGTIGSGAEALYEDPNIRLIGFDVYASNMTQFIADGHSIPLCSGSVDGVWVQAVLEHVLDPWSVVTEIGRVLKDDGLVYAETPFLQHVHEGAYDFTRFTESGHRWLFKRFAALASGDAQGPGTQLLWAIEHVARSLFRSRKVGQLAKCLFFWVRFLDHLCASPFAIDAASGGFFLGRKAAREVTPREMIAWYKGAQRAAANESLTSTVS